MTKVECGWFVMEDMNVNRRYNINMGIFDQNMRIYVLR
jgi:hypothetical protein